MRVGTLYVRLMIRDARTLKDKRRVVRSIKDRIRNHHNVSAAEVDALDSHQQAGLGFAMVSNDAQYIDAALAKIVDILRAHPIAQLIDYEVEIT